MECNGKKLRKYEAGGSLKTIVKALILVLPGGRKQGTHANAAETIENHWENKHI